jgi:ubiquinone/menaquinone biosynthesis C-methylase UbiE
MADLPGRNYDPDVVEGFGSEWERFDQRALDEHEALELFNRYFGMFPWDTLPSGAVGFDAGCGSGRWARFVAPRVRQLHCVDASEAALRVAASTLSAFDNCVFHRATVDTMPIADASCDFGYSIGVLHHIPDTITALRTCVRKLKPRALFLVYLYYAFDNRPAWFRMIWRASEWGRRVLSRAPFRIRSAITDVLAGVLYWPLARTAKLLRRFGIRAEHLPLSAYSDQSFYVMRTDALDRFGTRLEKRFTRAEIMRMMEDAGLEQIRFSDAEPYWVATGIRTGGDHSHR